jgi:hypothetical protein
MVDGCRAQGDPELAPKAVQDVEQRRRVGPARARDQDVVSAPEQPALAHRPPHRRGDYERTLEHARGEGKPHLGPVT